MRTGSRNEWVGRTCLVLHTTRLVGFTLVCLLAMSASRARPIRATDMRQLNRQSDIIAIGVIQVLAMERESEVRP